MELLNYLYTSQSMIVSESSKVIQVKQINGKVKSPRTPFYSVSIITTQLGKRIIKTKNVKPWESD